VNDNDKVVELLARIEENQRKALEAQQQHLQVAQAHLDRSNRTVQESIELQRAAVARQAQITRFILPVLVVLLVLIAYLVVKWRIL
jgi:hypothetical protein